MIKIKQTITNLIYLGIFFIAFAFVTILMFNLQKNTPHTKFNQSIFSRNKRKLFFKELNTLENQKKAIHAAGHMLGALLYPEIIAELNGMHLCDSQNPKKPTDFAKTCKSNPKNPVIGYTDNEIKENNYWTSDEWKNNPQTKTAAIDFVFKEFVYIYLGWMSEHYFFNTKPQSSWRLLNTDWHIGFVKASFLERHDPKDHNNQPQNNPVYLVSTWPAKAAKKAISIIEKPQNRYIIHLLATALMIEDGSLYEADTRYIFKHQKYPPHIQEKSKTRKINLFYKSNIKNIINYYPKIYVPPVASTKLWYLVIILATMDFVLLLFMFFVFLKSKTTLSSSNDIAVK